MVISIVLLWHARSRWLQQDSGNRRNMGVPGDVNDMLKALWMAFGEHKTLVIHGEAQW
jgi:hypothetical protein